MAEEKKKVPIAYAMRPVVDEQGNVTGYEKYNPVTTGNAVVVMNGEKKQVLNKALAEKQDALMLSVVDGCICQTFDDDDNN